MEGIQILNVRTLEDPQTLDDSSVESDGDSLGSSLVIDEEESPTPTTPEKKYKKKVYPKPPLSYSILAGLAFKNCFYGNVPVSAVYSFIIKHFPYYKNAPAGWKNSIRHNLSMNKCFKRLPPDAASEMTDAVEIKARKGLLWTLNPDRVIQMEQGITRAMEANRIGVLAAMRYPEDLDCVLAGRDYEGNVKYYDSYDEDSEEEVRSPEKQPEQTFIFTQFKDGVLPLVTLYSKTPALHSKYSSKYPVVK